MNAGSPEEMERIRRDNEALNEQVKRLVQVEQRLYRSQNELNCQLENMRALGSFALFCSGSDDSARILEKAVETLSRAFTLDFISAVRINIPERMCEVVAAAPSLTGTRSETLTPGRGAWLDTLPPVSLFHLPSACVNRFPDGLMACLLPAGSPILDAPRGNLLVFCIRNARRRPAVLLMAYASEKKRAMYWPEDLSERNLPFLDLFAAHVERALENAALTADLRERTSELSESLRELEQAQNHLIQAQKMEAIGQLAGGIAHDFNNILTVILGHATQVGESLDPGDPRRAGVARIQEAGERAASITGQLLAFGRRQIQRREPVDLNGLAVAMAGMLERLIGEHIRLSLSLNEGASTVRADPAQMQQVLMNLVVNARDALPEGGEIRIVTRPATREDVRRCDTPVDPSAFLVLEVSDNGVGLDEAIRDRVFEPFFSTKEPGSGTGLGLAVVYGIVRQGEGHVFVDSVSGKGTRFTLLVPLSSEPERAAPALPAQPQPGESGETVLLVEDEDLIREIVRDFLNRAGYTVLEARDGQQAIDDHADRIGDVDILVSDVVMPRMGGLRLAGELRKRVPDLPVVFMSGYSREHAEGGRDQSPPDARSAFLLKPFTRDRLLTVLRKTLQESGNTA